MSLSEFIAALGVYVRQNEEDGTITDTRDDRVAELAKPEVSVEVLTLMKTTDLAAMLSGSVAVRDLKAARSETAKKLKASAKKLCASDALPLVAKTQHPANQVLDKLLSCKDGIKTYLAVWSHLAQAKLEGVPGVYTPAKAPKHNELITAPMDPEAASDGAGGVDGQDED